MGGSVDKPDLSYEIDKEDLLLFLNNWLSVPTGSWKYTDIIFKIIRKFIQFYNKLKFIITLILVYKYGLIHNQCKITIELQNGFSTLQTNGKLRSA